MEVVPTNFTVADYCASLNRNEIQVNRHYQRSDRVWPPAARSFLIETILLNYPVPKLSLYQKIDVKTKSAFKEIVDGQQRSAAIRDYFEDKYRLSRKLDTDPVAGKKYSELPEEYQARFLNYRLSADLFVGATPEAIREVFRRINSYTVPLNPEEERHATYQGAFKWFIYRLSKAHDSNLSRIGVFGEKQFVRMADAKLYSEICHAFLNGIRTTKKPDLNKLYEAYDAEFGEEANFSARIASAVERVNGWEDLHNGPLMKPHIIYALLLAIAHVENPVETLNEYCENSEPHTIDDSDGLRKLSELAEVLEDPETHKTSDYSDFLEACTSKTNVGSQRGKRFRWFCEALMTA